MLAFCGDGHHSATIDCQACYGVRNDLCSAAGKDLWDCRRKRGAGKVRKVNSGQGSAWTRVINIPCAVVLIWLLSLH